MSRKFETEGKYEAILQRKESRILFNLLFVTFTIIGVFLGAINCCTFMRCDTVTATITDIQEDTERYYDSESHRYETRTVRHVYLSYSYNGKSYDGITSPSSSGDLYEQIDILVEPADPYICYTPKKLILWPALFFFCAVVLFVFSRTTKSTTKSGNERLSEDDYLDENSLEYDSYEDNASDDYYDYNEAANYNTGQVDEYLFYRETPQTKPEETDAANDTTMQPEMVQDTPTILAEEKEIPPAEVAEEPKPYSYEPPETVLGTYDKIYNNPSKEQEKPVDPLENYNANDYGTDYEDLQDAYDKYFNYEEESADDDKYNYFFRKR